MAVVERAQTEVWKNVTAGTVFVRKLDHRGELARHEQIDSGKSFSITSEERKINMDMAGSAPQDVFRNGTLQEVRLIEGDEEARELAANPNAMSESDMRALMKAHHKTFEAKIVSIQNPVTLDRMLAVAYEEDASVKRVERIRLRQAEVGGAITPVSSPANYVGGGMDRSVLGRPVSPR